MTNSPSFENDISACDRWVMRQRIVTRSPSLEQWIAECKIEHPFIRDEKMIATFRHRYSNYEQLGFKLRSRFFGKAPQWEISDAHQLLKRRVNKLAGSYLRHLRKGQNKG